MNKKYIKHLSLDDRKNIELGIVEGLSKSQIARILGVQRSTLRHFIYRMQW